MTDYIDRQAAIEAAYQGLQRPSNTDEWKRVLEQINAVPSAEVKPVKHGKWIVEHGVLYGHGEDAHYGDLWHCSECGRRELDVEGWDYCPTCGAKMGETRL